MLRLVMESTPTRLEYSATKAEFEVQVDRGSYSWQGGIGSYTMQQGKFSYRQDSTEFRKSMGFMGILDFAKDAAERGRQATQKAIEGYVERGIAMSKIHKGATIPDAWERYLPYNNPGSLELKPTAEIDWHFEYQPLYIQYNPKSFEFLGFSPAGISTQYQPHSFSINVSQKPSLTIDVVDDGR